MFVAGAATCFPYEGAGDGVLFDSDLYHRGGLMRYGTVKVAFFFKVEEVELPGSVQVKEEEGEQGETSGVAQSLSDEEEP